MLQEREFFQLFLADGFVGLHTGWSLPVGCVENHLGLETFHQVTDDLGSFSDEELFAYACLLLFECMNKFYSCLAYHIAKLVINVVTDKNNVLFLCNLSTKYTTFVPKISQLKSKVTYFYVFLVLAISLLSACSTSKYVPQGSYLLTSVEIRSDEKSFDGSQLFPYIRQKANSKWFSLFKIPMGTYTLAGKDSTKWINRTLKRIGERPVVFDTLTARLTMDDLRQAMINQGYLHASVTHISSIPSTPQAGIPR